MSAKGAVLASLASFTGSCTATDEKTVSAVKDRLKLGMASYTFREFNLEDTIKMTKRLGLKRIALKSFHLPLESSTDEIKTIAKTVRDAGLDLYGCGVVYMKSEDEVHNAFDYAKAAGIGTIIGVPNHNLLELVNKKVQEYDIKLAIHNHGPGDELYPSPESAYEKVKDLDPRMGLCIDVGHTERIAVNPAEAILKFADRLHDVHLKDVTESTADGTTIEIGRGVIEIPQILRALLKINYAGTVAFEYEKDKHDPLAGVAESVGYTRGVLAVI
ncbi:TIM barrel protein [candidate division KSB1 bacterium]|nr:TIM barrel protein [candidate division KSB1 bacterium]